LKTEQDHAAFLLNQTMRHYWPDWDVVDHPSLGGQPLKPCGAMLLQAQLADHDAVHRAERTEMLASTATKRERLLAC
jgi:hypothetical protein